MVSRSWFSKVTSFLFFGFLESRGSPQLWNVFKFYGHLVDIFLAKKRLKSGAHFGFVRYKGVLNLVAMEKRLGCITIGSKNLSVFIAKDSHMRGFSRRYYPGFSGTPRGDHANSWSDGRSFAEVVSSNRLEHPQFGSLRRNARIGIDESLRKGVPFPFNLSPSKEVSLMLHSSLIGEVANVSHLESIESLCTTNGLAPVDFKLLGGLAILLSFENKDAADKVVRNANLGYYHWLQNVRLWSNDLVVSYRFS